MTLLYGVMRDYGRILLYICTCVKRFTIKLFLYKTSCLPLKVSWQILATFLITLKDVELNTTLSFSSSDNGESWHMTKFFL